jgi:phenylacetate-CoA ligase
MDHLTVRVEAREGASGDDRDVAAARLREQVKARIGVSVDVEVVDPAAVTRSVGKARRVVDERDRG